MGRPPVIQWTAGFGASHQHLLLQFSGTARRRTTWESEHALDVLKAGQVYFLTRSVALVPKTLPLVHLIKRTLCTRAGHKT